MTAFDIEDPSLRTALTSHTSHVHLIHEYKYETAFLVYRYVSERLKHHHEELTESARYIEYLGQFFDHTGTGYDEKSPSYTDGPVLSMSSVIEDNQLNKEQKARLLISVGNLFEMNRILIDIANQLYESEHS